MRLKTSICIVLALVTLAVYWPARHFGITFYDDQSFLFTQAALGLTWKGLEWALTAVVASNWHPITTFSFVLMRSICGFNPGAEHLLNVFVHAANGVLLFWVLALMTSGEAQVVNVARAAGAQRSARTAQAAARRTHPTVSMTWRCAFVAAIFAWHPLHVESVAWISERKDVMYMFFMLLSILCYARYSSTPPSSSSSSKTISYSPFGIRDLHYWLSLFFFILSFLSKGTAVTLPFLLLLLDIWPLKRLQFAPNPTQSSRDGPGPMRARSSASLPAAMPVRALLAEKIPFVALAVIFSYVTFCVHSAQNDVTSLETFGVVARLENVPLNYIAYLGKIFWPTKLALPYGFPDSFDTVRAVLCALLLLAISALCVFQLPRRPYLAAGWFWYLVALAPVVGLIKTSGATIADHHTYVPLVGPTLSLVWLVCDCARTGLLRKILPGLALVILIACIILTRRQLMFWQDNTTLFEHTIAVTPENALAHVPLAMSLEGEGQFRQAAVQYRIALALHPDNQHYLADYHFGGLLARMGQYREAERRLEAALELNPDSTVAMNDLAWLLAACPDPRIRDGARAVKLAERACALTHYKTTILIGTLAAAYARDGRFANAIATAQKAMALAQQYRDKDLLETNRHLLELYQAHQAYQGTGAP